MKLRKLLALMLALTVISLFAVGAYADETDTAVPDPNSVDQVIRPDAPVAEGSYDSESASVKLTWNEAENVLYYAVYRNEEFLTNTEEPLYSDTAVVAGNSYSYYVIAHIDEEVRSDASETVTVVCPLPDLPPLKAPAVSGSVDPETGLVKITWNSVENAVGYILYRSDSPNSVGSAKINVTDTSYTDTDAELGVTYYYTVKAVAANPEDDSELSNKVSGCRKLPTPQVNINNVVSTGKIKLTWESVSGAAGYEVYRASSENGKYTRLKTVTGTAFTNTSATVGTTYYYKVKAVHSTSKASSSFSEVKSAAAALPAPVIKTISNVASSGKIKLTWDAVPGAVKYEIYRATSEDGEFVKTWSVTGTSYTNTSAEVGATYFYKVKAIHNNSNANSAFSGIKSKICTLPAPKVTISNVAASGKVNLKWTAIEGAVKYEIYRATSSGGTYTKMWTTTLSSYTNTSATAGKVYYYKVKAIHEDPSANSAYSGVKSRRCNIAAPKIKTTHSSTLDSITVNWEKVSGADGYYVYRRYHSSSDWKLVKTVTSGNTTSFKKDSSGRYYYKISAYVESGGKKYAGAYSDVFAVRTVSKRSLTIKNNKTEFKNTLSWKTMKAATEYLVYYKIGSNGSWEHVATITADPNKETQSYVHEVQHGKFYYYRIRARYIEDGITTNGAYGATSYKQIISYQPDLDIVMSTKTVKSTDRTVITVTNNGPCGMRFYSEDAKWLDHDSVSNCRDAYLCDYDAYLSSGSLTKISSVWIDPGETVNLLVAVKGSKTRYDSEVAIYLTGYSDGLNREAYLSACSGALVYKK